MAKFNKYWGFVALGAATAAAAGAVAAIITKKNRTESIGFDDDFDDFDDFDIPEKSDEKETAEDFVAWEDTEEESTDCCTKASEECDCTENTEDLDNAEDADEIIDDLPLEEDDSVEE